MHVVICVALAFVAGSAAGLDTSLKNYASEVGHELGLPAEDRSGRRTDVTAVSTERDTRNERFEIGFGEIGISASRAVLGALEAAVDACSQNAKINLKRTRMRLEDLLSVGHGSLLP
jgi:hypothetical protein